MHVPRDKPGNEQQLARTLAEISAVGSSIAMCFLQRYTGRQKDQT